MFDHEAILTVEFCGILFDCGTFKFEALKVNHDSKRHKGGREVALVVVGVTEIEGGRGGS